GSAAAGRGMGAGPNGEVASPRGAGGAGHGRTVWADARGAAGLGLGRGSHPDLGWGCTHPGAGAERLAGRRLDLSLRIQWIVVRRPILSDPRLSPLHLRHMAQTSDDRF